tara:strand:+ start:101 stop:469 length:369 start_codon:yes stop_codon:yes gene_type:complete
MYFEDIYSKIEPLWKRKFSLEGIEETETYIKDISDEWDKLDNELKKDNYSWWEFSMLFTMYQTLTAFAINKWNKEKVKSISINDIPITLFEEYFRKNMEPEDEFEGNEEYLKQYKGLKPACK